MKRIKTYFEHEMPQHWHEIRLKRVLTKLSRSYEPNAELLICSNKGAVFHRGDSKMGLVSDKEEFYQGVVHGDLLIHGMDTWHGAIAISDYDGKCTGVVHVCDSKQSKRFICYYLQMLAFQKIYKAITNGVRQNTSDFRSWDKVGTIEIALPPLDEQSRIVAYLDAQCAAIDVAIAKLTREIDLVGEYKASIISEAVTGKIDLRNTDIPDFDPIDDGPINADEEGTEDEDD
jgi:type I restriction enzyme S subunit